MTRLEIITQQVRNGTYRIDAARVAEAMQDRLFTLAIAYPDMVLTDSED